MSEELLQRDLLKNPVKIGKWNFYNIGNTTLKSLKDHSIITNISYPKFDRRKPDGLVTHNGNVIALVSNKIPSKLTAHKDKDLQDWINVTKILRSKLLILTDAKNKSYWFNAITGKLITDENGSELNLLFNPNIDETHKLIEQILESIDDKNNQLKRPELKDPTNLAKSVWQDIWSVSGDDAETCLYTFVELFIFKYLSDLNILTGNYGFDELIERYKKDEPNSVLDYYANYVRKEIKRKFKENSGDGTTIINGSTFINKKGEPVTGYSTAFKKVLEKFKEYESKNGKFDKIHYEFKSKIFETFLKESISKKNWGQYFTPLKIVRAIVKMTKSDIRDGMSICDPACGVGKFLLEIIAENPYRFYEFTKSNELKSKIVLLGYDRGFEDKEQKTIILAKANMLIYLSDLIKEHPDRCDEFSKIFNSTFLLQTQSTLGTLFMPEVEKHDLIITNPPYVTSGSSNIKDEIKATGLEYHFTINATGIEGLFVEWIVKALKKGGKAFVIIPDGLLSRTNDKKLRKYLIDECYIDGIISLPSKAFFTTLKKTYILIITKKEKNTVKQKDPVFTYLVSEIGETLNIDRIETQINHLDEASNLYNQFKGSKKHFITSDDRCKIVDFSFFEENYDKSWIIENLWDNDTLIKLGIKEKEIKISVSELAAYLDDLTATIKYYYEQLNSIKNNIPEYTTIKLTDENYFESYATGLGYKRKEYSGLDTSVHEDIPVYTAALKPVAWFNESKTKKPAIDANEDFPHISFASDGDGTAGTNIILHTSKYYINTSRISFKIKDSNIDSEYVFYYIQDIKIKYGYDFKHKATLTNIQEIEIKIPTKNGNFDLDTQKLIASQNKIISDLKRELSEKLGQISNAKVEVVQ